MYAGNLGLEAADPLVALLSVIRHLVDRIVLRTGPVYRLDQKLK